MTEKLEKVIDRSVKLWQVILATVALIVSLGGKIYDLKTDVESLKLKNNFNESIQRDQSILLKEINGKLTDIQITLQNKEDRIQKN